MFDAIKSAFDWLLPHHPWIVYCLVMSVVTRVLDRALLQGGRANQPIYLVWPRRAESMFPIIVAFVVGYWIAPYPEPFIVSRWGSFGYYASAGVVSLFLYDLAVQLLAKRGIKVSLPGESNYPPPPVVEIKEPTVIVPPKEGP